MFASGVKVKLSSSTEVSISPFATRVPSALFKVAEVGILVTKIDKESPSESVGADKFKAPDETSSDRLMAIFAPALGELLDGIIRAGLEPPPPPPPHAATMNEIKLAEASFGFLREKSFFLLSRFITQTN